MVNAENQENDTKNHINNPSAYFRRKGGRSSGLGGNPLGWGVIPRFGG